MKILLSKWSGFGDTNSLNELVLFDIKEFICFLIYEILQLNGQFVLVYLLIFLFHDDK